MSAKISNWIIIARLAIVLFLFGALLFGPAGTLNWPEAWLFLIIYFTWAILIVTWLKKKNPDLLKERLAWGKKAVKGWDKIITLVATPLFIAMFLIPGLDVVRFQWSQAPLSLKALGFVGIHLSLILIFFVMRENTYLSRIVEIQEDRYHKVIITGPYKYVRHPMYVGVITFVFCIPLALGSLYALFPSSLLGILIAIRTYLEDKTLQKDLPGYNEYAKKTRYRLLPWVW
jgi:protein-S-isoprenylcysteine O-methyltransferase Ste14